MEMGIAYTLAFCPHPSPLPEGEGNSLGERGYAYTLALCPHPNPLPEGEGNSLGRGDMLIPSPPLGGEGKGEGGRAQRG